ncbi:Protein of unknown function [Gryllus bimaculatus]|nr:Protein of unknown function [Gryllus bimaculatus]
MPLRSVPHPHQLSIGASPATKGSGWGSRFKDRGGYRTTEKSSQLCYAS